MNQKQSIPALVPMTAATRKKPYMHDDQLAYFRARLIESLRTKEEKLAVTRFELNPMEHEAQSDDNDRASQEEQMSNARASCERLLREIPAVREAIKRLNAGEYGYCVDTGEEIGLDRLIAVPTAIRTVSSQGRTERANSLYRMEAQAA